MANLANGEFQTSKSSKFNRVAGAYRLNRVQACSCRCFLWIMMKSSFKVILINRIHLKTFSSWKMTSKLRQQNSNAFCLPIANLSPTESVPSTRNFCQCTMMTSSRKTKHTFFSNEEFRCTHGELILNLFVYSCKFWRNVSVFSEQKPKYSVLFAHYC